MTLEDAKKLLAKCTMALITSNWTKMTDRHLPPNGEGTLFLTASANDVPNLVAKAVKCGGAGGGTRTACVAYKDPGEPNKIIVVGTFTSSVGSTNPGAAACHHIKVVIGCNPPSSDVIFYSAYPVLNLPAAANLIGAL